ncbi:MAG: hypothetical protein KAG98_07325, partial [Lentisphaeria bacterium]|nr:hypothetical protein [Lentisphaeria bacterium]
MKINIFTNWLKVGVKALLLTTVMTTAMAVDLPIHMNVYDSNGTPIQEAGADAIRSFGISTLADA